MATMKKKPTIKFRQSLFWDVDPKKIDPKKHARYIIERVLDLGNDNEVRWLTHQYPSKLIKETFKKSRALHPKSTALWKLIYH